MKLFSSRKGQEELTLPPMFLIAMFGFLLLSIIYAVFSIGSNEAYLRQLYVTQLGLDLQSLQALGKDINAERDIMEAGPYHLVFTGSEVYTESGGFATSRFLFTNVPGFFFKVEDKGQGFSPEPGKEGIGELKLYKMGLYYGVAKPQDVPSKYMLTCDAPKGPAINSITAEGVKDSITVAAYGITADVYASNLAKTVQTGSKAKGDDAAILVRAGTNPSDAVKAYYNTNPGSKRLACEILNKITTQFKVAVRMIPVNPAQLGPGDPRNSLNTKKPAVLLEIGNARNKDSILKNSAQLALEINHGVEAY